VKRRRVKSAPRQAKTRAAQGADTVTASLLPMKIQIGDRFTDHTRWLDTWTGVGLVVVGVERRSVDMHAVLRGITGDHEAIRRCVMSDDSVLAAG
jgi:hypothetical protein